MIINFCFLSNSYHSIDICDCITRVEQKKKVVEKKLFDDDGVDFFQFFMNQIKKRLSTRVCVCYTWMNE